MKAVEQKTGKKFGDAKNPLLVSVRSGAKFSMPGMMDTVLNLGLNDDDAQGPGRAHRQRALRLRCLPPLHRDVRPHRHGHRGQEVRRGPGPGQGEARRQAGHRPGHRGAQGDRRRSTRSCTRRRSAATSPPTPTSSSGWPSAPSSAPGWASAPSTTATPSKIAHDLGTAVNVVTMVFGNMGDDSGTGVAFTRNPSTGEKRPLRRVPAERPGRGRGRRHSHPEEDRPARRGHARGLRAVPAGGRACWRSTTATCRTWSSPSSAASSGCCRPASGKRTAAAGRQDRRGHGQGRASSPRKRPSCASSRRT